MMQFLPLIRLVAQSFSTVVRCPDRLKDFRVLLRSTKSSDFVIFVSLYSWAPETHALNQASTHSRNSLLALVPQVVRRLYRTHGTFLTIAVEY